MSMNAQGTIEQTEQVTWLIKNAIQHLLQDILNGYLNISKGKNSQKEEIWQCLVPRLTMASSAALNKSFLLSSSNFFSKKS